MCFLLIFLIYLQVHEPQERILSKDPAISGHNFDKYVFTDISLGLNNKERICVVRYFVSVFFSDIHLIVSF